MNEITQIHLGRQAFTISVDAQKLLRDYLAAVKKHAGSDEVAEEVEMRMAELLTERGITGDKVVLAKDVEYLKEQLGEPGEFDDEEAGKTHAEAEDAAPRRLFRDTNHAMIAGVAAGLANYLNIDATIIRILFIVFTFFGGSGVLVYLILWLIVPEARTSSERLQMRGKAVTVDSLKEFVDRADVSGAAQRAGTILGHMLEGVFKVVLGVIGGVLAFASAVTLLSLVTATILLLTHHGKVAGEVFFPIGANETWALLAGVASAAIIFLLLTLVGISMVRRKWPIPGWVVAALFGLLFVTTPIAGALTADIVPDLQHRFDSLHHTQTQTVSAFKNLDANGHDTRFVFVPDTKYKVEYKYLGKANLSTIHATVSGGTLHIDSNGFTDKQLCAGVCLYSGPDLQIEVHAPQLDHITVNGGEANFISHQPLQQQSMVLDVAGNARADVDYANPTKAVLHANGSGMRHLELTLRTDATEDDSLTLDDEGAAAFAHVDELDFTTNRRCDESDAYVSLLSDAGKIVVNGRNVDGNGDTYDRLRSQDTSTDLNCVYVTSGDLGIEPARAPEDAPASKTPQVPAVPAKV